MKKFITMRILFFGLCLLQCLMLAGQQVHSAEQYQRNPKLALEDARQLERQGHTDQARRCYRIYSGLTGTDVSTDIARLDGNRSTANQSKKTNSSSVVNGHEAVDLGLSVKWATCNVGASSPSDYGNYYAWGETTPKSSYARDNSKTYGKSMGSICGNAQYDAATANWGSPWRLPTKEELEELESKCTWTWTSQGGHNGYKITGPNGNSIFLPAAGYGVGIDMASVNKGKDGSYWSGTPYESDSTYAYLLYFYSGSWGVDWGYRFNGSSVRPVRE